jgi:hypothetical protein
LKKPGNSLVLDVGDGFCKVAKSDGRGVRVIRFVSRWRYGRADFALANVEVGNDHLCLVEKPQGAEVVLRDWSNGLDRAHVMVASLRAAEAMLKTKADDVVFVSSDDKSVALASSIVGSGVRVGVLHPALSVLGEERVDVIDCGRSSVRLFRREGAKASLVSETKIGLLELEREVGREIISRREASRVGPECLALEKYVTGKNAWVSSSSVVASVWWSVAQELAEQLSGWSVTGALVVGGFSAKFARALRERLGVSVRWNVFEEFAGVRGGVTVLKQGGIKWFE